LLFLIKIPALQWRAVHFTLQSAMVSGLIILPSNSMTTQLQKLWIFYTKFLTELRMRFLNINLSSGSPAP